jgi:hypothetical protein
MGPRRHRGERPQPRLTGVGANVIHLGSNCIGKTRIPQNLAYQAVLRDFTVPCLTASEQLLNSLAVQEGSSAFRRRLARYPRPHLLVVDKPATSPTTTVKRHPVLRAKTYLARRRGVGAPAGGPRAGLPPPLLPTTLTRRRRGWGMGETRSVFQWAAGELWEGGPRPAFQSQR